MQSGTVLALFITTPSQRTQPKGPAQHLNLELTDLIASHWDPQQKAFLSFHITLITPKSKLPAHETPRAL